MTKLNVEEGKRFDVLGAKGDRTPAEEKEYNDLNHRNTDSGRSDNVNGNDGRNVNANDGRTINDGRNVKNS